MHFFGHDKGKDVVDDVDADDDDDEEGTCLVWEHWWVGVDFKQPRLQVWVQHHVEAKKLKITMVDGDR